MKEKVPEYDVGQIQRLPPGEAKGARDLQAWAHRRAMGLSGLPEWVKKVLKCERCGFKKTVRVMKGAHVGKLCKRCEQKDIKSPSPTWPRPPAPLPEDSHWGKKRTEADSRKKRLMSLAAHKK